jgi:NAD(P)-dependent dehydrogenase (short-subunit alcohol dehydrogenase family)
MRTILITGANRGIGLALTTLYAQAGEKVIACCRELGAAHELQALAQKHAVTVLPLRVDDAQSIAALAKQLSNTAIDILINNAGVIAGPREKQTPTNMDFDAWADAFAINTMGPARVLQAFLPHLQLAKNAKVMNITSQLGALSLNEPALHAYSSTKAALNKFMRMAAVDLKQRGIAVGLIHPGWVKTDMGGAGASISPSVSAKGIVKVIDQLTLQNAGQFWKWDGSLHDW